MVGIAQIQEIGLIKNFLQHEDFYELQQYFLNHQALPNIGTDEFGRKLLGDETEPILKVFSEKILPKAKSFFSSETLLGSYSLFAEYSSTHISLSRHTDANACTYTVDLVLYQNSSWGLWVDGVEFLASPNDAVMFMGEKYEHWRDSRFDNTDKIGVVFFHYVEPSHWWFTRGPEHVEEIRNERRQMSHEN
jgi:hypothetical protein